MTSNHGRECRAEAMGEELSSEALKEITGGAEIDDYWKLLTSTCTSIEDACHRLVSDTLKGKISIGISNILVKKIEPYFENKEE